MRFTTRTEYGLICLIYMAHQKDGHPITTKEIVSGEGFSLTFTEKILQKLRLAKIVESLQGNHGGYVLARSPSKINLREIVEALEGHTFDVFCEPKTRNDIVCNHFHLCGLKPIWRKTKDLLDGFFEDITLEQIASKNDMNLEKSAQVAKKALL
ncbi:MAG: Rrf2 family transcriptional regulator [Candidatus Omnitrophica bacterium]|nr:Rrf2 family transcriptional regulator [Candidatus Omnitrophota bacterium]